MAVRLSLWIRRSAYAQQRDIHRLQEQIDALERRVVALEDEGRGRAGST